MNDSALQRIAKLNIERRRKTRRFKVVSVLAAFVVFCTTYALILPAITMDTTYYCGMEEHIHTEECYRSVIREAVTDESETSPPQASFAQEATTDLQTTDVTPTATSDTQADTDATTQTPTEVPTEPPTEIPTEAPTQSPEQPTQPAERVLICGKTEHIHNDDLCTVDPANKRETPEQWEESLPDHYTGQLAADLLLVAQSQLGYTESATDLQADSEGNLHGYTRYGDFAGSPHSSWNDAFIAFCMHYTDSTAFASLSATGSETMRALWEKYALYESADTHTASPGELIFLDMDKDTRADHTGIVSGYEGAAVTAILGDWQHAVQQAKFDDTGVILGYGLTGKVSQTEIPAAPSEEPTQSETSADLPNTQDAQAQPHIVGEMAEDDSNARKLAQSGFFTYWEQFLETDTTQSDATATEDVYPMRPLMMAPFSLTNTIPPSDEQIDNYGGENVSDDGEVTVSKTIEGTDLENVFDITLTVTSKTNLEIYQKDPDMAIVIVMDISQTMNSAYGSTTRYQAAVESAENFIDTFEANAPENTNAKLGFVAFNTSGHQIFELQDCTTPAQAIALKNEMRQETGAIINQSDYADLHTRFTNIEAGLAMANDMLAEVDANNKFIIFLSDGFPTTYMKTGTTTYEGYDPYCESGTPGTDGVFYDSVFGVHCDYGTSYSDKAAIRAREEAQRIQDAGVNIFSIGVDVGGQTIQYYIDASEGKSFSIVDRTGTTYEIGEPASQSSYENWLKNSIGSGYYYDTTNAEQLESAFQDIFDEIKRIQEENTSEIWTAIDPIPFYGQEGECVEFIHFYNKDGQPADRLDGEYAPGAEDSAVFIEPDGHIDWDLKNSGYTSESVTNGNITTTTYQYEMKYRVRLQNEKLNFIENEIYSTNATTTLTYQLVTTTDGVPEYSEYRKVNFPLPAVHGYLAEFSFNKIDHNRIEMEGVPFVLSHDTARCSLCHGDGTPTVLPDYTAVSDANGLVSFTDIPSGHIYTLTETVPEGYKTNGDTYSVTVAYNVLTITVTHADGTSEDLTEQGIGEIVNTPEFIPDTESLLVQKDLKAADGSALSDLLLQTAVFRFRVVKTDENGHATDQLFIFPGTTYTVIQNGTAIGTETVAADGTFTLKHGQIAVFEDLLNTANGSAFAVQELLGNDEVQTYEVSAHVGSQWNPPIQNTADTYTAFTAPQLTVDGAQSVVFRNLIDTEQLGELTVTKTLGSSGFDSDAEFKVHVTLGDTPVPVGTEYTVGGETRTVTQEGIVILKANETAVFSGLPAGTPFTVREIIENSSSVGTTTTNVALGKSVIATKQNDHNSEPSWITDGNTTGSYWDGGLAPSWYIIDLGAKYELSYFHAYNYCKDTRYYNYLVETSLDNSTYTQVAYSGDDESTTSGTRINLSEPVQARYIRVTVGRGANDEHKYVHTIEFQAFGRSVDESAYSATYSGEVTAGGTVNVSGNGALGTLPGNGTADVTVTNTKYPFSVSFPVSKTVPDYTGTASFDFTVEQVAHGTWTHIADQNGVTLTVTDSATAQATASIAFAAGTTGTFYYKVSETNAGGNFDYDETFYIVEVTAYGTHAAVTNVYRNGTESVDASDIAFFNTPTAQLTVSKSVSAPTTAGTFSFTATVTKDGQAVPLPQPPQDAGYTVDGNVITFTLQNNQSVCISDLPYGAVVTVQENLQGNVHMPYYRVEGENTDFVYGDFADLTVDSDSESIYFLNKAYYELPATGGSGTHLYTLGGSLMTAAAVFLLYKRKRERKGENAPS